MPRQIFIPAEVVDSIREHVESAIDRFIESFWSGNEDEDTLTGQLGFALRTGPHAVEVAQSELNGQWKWSIDYSKFRGRGQHATESMVGADGIIELRVTFGTRQEFKSLLFQAKTEWENSPDLVKQAMLLSTWREAAIVVNYTPRGVTAYPIDSVLESRGVRSGDTRAVDLKEALATYFLQCKIGDVDLVYDAKRRRLIWRSQSGELVATQFTIPQRLRVSVRAPLYPDKSLYDTLIPTSSIHKYRMAASPEEILAPLLTNESATPKARKRQLSLAYHPDSYLELPQRDLATIRMQEINAAYDELRGHGRR